MRACPQPIPIPLRIAVKASVRRRHRAEHTSIEVLTADFDSFFPGTSFPTCNLQNGSMSAGARVCAALCMHLCE